MKVNSIVIASLLVLTQGCNSKNESVSTSISEGPEVLYEGMIADIPMTIETKEEFEVSFEQVKGEMPAFASFNTNTNIIRVIAPSVEVATDIELKVKIRTESGKLSEELVAFSASPITLPSLTELPEPNVFSSGNVAKHNYKKFDDKGIPLTSREQGDFYYPVSIAAYGYDLYNYYYQTQDEEILAKFLGVAKWLKENCVYSKYGFCSFRSYFPIEAYELTTDWTTSMGQGQAISSLIGAHFLTGDDSYAEVAKDAISAYFYPVQEKGLAAELNGYTWFEEYGSDTLRSYVFNGAFFSLSGVRDFIKNYDTETAKQVLSYGTEGIVENLDVFDFDFTSRYDYSSLNQLASTKKGPDAYHELHILQVGWLYNVTGEKKLYDFAHKLLKQDMAGIKLVNTEVYNKSIEILEIEASNSHDPEKLGVARAVDGYWTYNRYWATYDEPVDLKLTLHENILDAGTLEKITLTSVTKVDMPVAIDVLEVTEGGQERLLKAGIELSDFADKAYSHETGGYYSYTAVFDVFVPVTSNKIIVRMAKSSSGLIKIREIDVQYPRVELLEDLISRYQ